MLKKVISIIVLGIILFSSFSICSNAWTLSESNGNVEAYYLYDLSNDILMADKNTTMTISASSTVKMMAAYVVLDSGISLDKEIIITTDMLKNISGRFMGLVPGDKMTVRDLLYSMICASFNDAAHALAFAISGSIEAFVDNMNNQALSLGMRSTNYVDATGISKDSKTTVNDIIILSKHLLNNQEYLEITSTKTYQLSPNATCEYNKITNRSSLISSYKGLHNFNTGSTSDNGDSSVIYLSNDNTSLLCIVMNAKFSNDDTSNAAEYYIKKLLSHGLYDYSSKILLKANKAIDYLPVKYSVATDEVAIYPKNDISAYISNEIDINEGVEINYYLYDSELIAPLKTGDEVGVVILSKNGKYIASSPIVVKVDISKNVFLFLMDKIKEYITSTAFILFVIAFVFLMTWHYIKMKKHFDKMYKQEPRKTIKYYRK